MNPFVFDSSTTKAIAGGIVGLLLAEAARYGFQPNPAAKDALAVIVTALVGYVAGHATVFYAPANQPKV